MQEIENLAQKSRSGVITITFTENEDKYFAPLVFLLVLSVSKNNLILLS